MKEKPPKVLKAKLFQLEVELDVIQNAIAQTKKESHKNDDKILQMEELFNNYIYKLKEYKNIENHLSKFEESDFSSLKEDYQSVKDLLNDASLSELDITSIKGCVTNCTDCVTNCTDCVTNCTECVTSACVQCVTNGSGNLCGIGELSMAPCRPKPDVFESMNLKSVKKMEVQWNE